MLDPIPISKEAKIRRDCHKSSWTPAWRIFLSRDPTAGSCQSIAEPALRVCNAHSQGCTTHCPQGTLITVLQPISPSFDRAVRRINTDPSALLYTHAVHSQGGSSSKTSPSRYYSTNGGRIFSRTPPAAARKAPPQKPESGLPSSSNVFKVYHNALELPVRDGSPSIVRTEHLRSAAHWVYLQPLYISSLACLRVPY